MPPPGGLLDTPDDDDSGGPAPDATMPANHSAGISDSSDGLLAVVQRDQAGPENAPSGIESVRVR